MTSDNDGRETTAGPETGDESFAELFEQSQRQGTGRLTPGQKVSARVLKAGPEWIFIDTGQKGEGIVDAKEFLDQDGQMPIREGDTIAAYFLSSRRGEMRFTTRVGSGSTGSAQLEEAWQAGVPVEGVVEKEIRGGFEVRLAGTVRAFCPYSQVALRRVENPEALIGARLAFCITDYSEKGRNIVVSRRVLLEEERRRLREETRATLSEGQTVTGTVTSLREFGAFVDIGGLEGLVPVSEASWTRVKDLGDLLTVGQQVTVVIKTIDRENERISLSIRDTQIDPWQQAATRFPEGSFQNGVVARLTPFGAFVTLADGIDGLIHISRLGGGKRINHPREVLSEGERIEVKIDGVDPEGRRISLSPAAAAKAAHEEESVLAEFRKQATEAPKGMGTLGDLLMAAGKRRKTDQFP